MFVSTDDQGPALYNKIPPHIDKLASSIFCPVDPRFDIEYENSYGRDELQKAQIAARWLTREFSRRDLDLLFDAATETSLRYGSAIIKLLWGHDGLGARILQPWQFGVYVETNCEIDTQEALCETSYITAEELWRRIAHRGDAKDIYRRAVAHARRGVQDDALPAGLYNVLPPSAIGIGDATDHPAGGGVIDTAAAPMMPAISPEIAASLLEAHELFVVNDETGDYTTIQMIEPDILLAPRLMRTNLFFPFAHPYIHVQINPQENYFWGRSEVSDLVPLQRLLSARLLDVKKIMSLQYRRIRGFYGFSDMNDERYDQFVESGWIAQETPGAKIEDLTPPMPSQWKEEIQAIIEFFNDVAGLDGGALSGRGEPGIRSGNHFQGAVRMASPRLRDKSLRAERQFAAFGEKALWLSAAKDARAHWLDPNDLAGKTDFVLAELPDDARVVVDSHSASPIYENDHANLVAFGMRAGILDPEDGLTMLPYPNRDALRDKLKHRAMEREKMMQSLPPEERALAMLGVAPHRKKEHHET